jgi:hypothetical protein
MHLLMVFYNNEVLPSFLKFSSTLVFLTLRGPGRALEVAGSPLHTFCSDSRAYLLLCYSAVASFNQAKSYFSLDLISNFWTYSGKNWMVILFLHSACCELFFEMFCLGINFVIGPHLVL